MHIGGTLIARAYLQTISTRHVITNAVRDVYINDLIPEINELDCGVCIGEDTPLSILLYAGDLVLLSLHRLFTYIIRGVE